MSNKAPFFRFGEDMLVCPVCKKEYKVPLPQPISAIAALLRAFDEKHKVCADEGDEE